MNNLVALKEQAIIDYKKAIEDSMKPKDVNEIMELRANEDKAKFDRFVANLYALEKSEMF